MAKKNRDIPPEEEAPAAAPAPAAAGTANAKAKPEVKLTSEQRAAVVVVALGVEKASLVYQYMEPEELEQLTLEVAKLGFLDGETTETVLEEFYQRCMTNKAVTEGGFEYA